jgi:hypothetical protein
LKEKVAVPVSKVENTVVGIRRVDHVAPSIRKSWPKSGGSSVGIVLSRTQACGNPVTNRLNYGTAHTLIVGNHQSNKNNVWKLDADLFAQAR